MKSKFYKLSVVDRLRVYDFGDKVVLSKRINSEVLIVWKCICLDRAGVEPLESRYESEDCNFNNLKKYKYVLVCLGCHNKIS